VARRRHDRRGKHSRFRAAPYGGMTVGHCGVTIAALTRGRKSLSPTAKKIVARGLLGLLGAAVVAYAIDAIQVRVRLATGGPSSVYDTVTVYYAAELKGGKYEVFTDRPDHEMCASSLFPQMGYAPCWYLRQHKVKVVE
jgi:hypothetical protein